MKHRPNMGKPLRVLIVEDSADDLELIVRVLRRGGFEPQARRVDTREAMRSALADAEWDVVLADHAMPGFSSGSALAEVRATGRDIPFLVVSGVIGEETAVELMRAGAHDYLLKDRLARLPAAIERELNDAAARAEHARAEFARRESEAKYRTLVEQASDGIAVIQDGVVRYANPRLAEMHGSAPDELIGTRFTDHVPREERRGLINWLRQLAATPDRRIPCETVIRCRDERLLPVQISGAPFVFEGRPADIAIIRDITERRRAEAAMRAQSDELARANERLKQLSAAKSDFVAAVSHELRTPLMTVVEGIGLVVDGSLGAVNSKQEKYLKLAADQAGRLARLIDDLLDLAKIERGKVTASPTAIDIGPVAGQIGENYAGIARERGVRLRVEVPVRTLRAFADIDHYQRILTNLVSNAIKFTPAGGTVTIRAESSEECVLTTVADSGIGIPDDQMGLLFSEFAQVRHPSHYAPDGTGLGLALCRQLVELNQGRIGCRSCEGRGSEFWFTLPALRSNR